MDDPLELPEFNEYAICRACGNDDIASYYYKDSSESWDCERHWHTINFEHIHRHCDRCRFMWLEKPISEDTLARLIEEAEEDAAELGVPDGEDEHEAPSETPPPALGDGLRGY